VSVVPLRTEDAGPRLLEFQAFMDGLLADKKLSREEVFHALADHYTKASRRDRELWAEVFMARCAGLTLAGGTVCEVKA
jgi:hypothetical protein